MYNTREVRIWFTVVPKMDIVIRNNGEKSLPKEVSSVEGSLGLENTLLSVSARVYILGVSYLWCDKNVNQKKS